MPRIGPGVFAGRHTRAIAHADFTKSGHEPNSRHLMINFTRIPSFKMLSRLQWFPQHPKRENLAHRALLRIAEQKPVIAVLGRCACYACTCCTARSVMSSNCG